MKRKNSENEKPAAIYLKSNTTNRLKATKLQINQVTQNTRILQRWPGSAINTPTSADPRLTSSKGARQSARAYRIHKAHPRPLN